MGSDDRWSHLRRRQLSRREEVLWYLAAAITYVLASLVEKGLLNWLVGPVWLVAVVTLGPALTDRVLRRRA